MCYDVVAHTKKKLDYAIKRGWDDESIEKLQEALKGLDGDLLPFYKTSGFEHPKLLAFCNNSNMQPEALEWGLIPHWAQDDGSAAQIQNKTLNARIESLHEKVSFAEAFKTQRCIFMLDAFYEHFHKNGKTYPHLIQHQDEKPLVMAGLWDVWTDEDGTERKTISMVTCKANKFMSEIHNNPKMHEPRMPLILEESDINLWLGEMSDEQLKHFQETVHLKMENIKLKSHTVNPLKGKLSLDNSAKAHRKIAYPELEKGLFD